ncbi:ATP-binding protein [Actinoplanes sp. NPDC000266]
MTTSAESLAAEALRWPSASGIDLAVLRGEISQALGGSANIDEMLDLYEWLISPSTRIHMTSWDWLLLTLSTYLHDLGLVVTEREYEARGETGFATFLRDLDSGDFGMTVAQLPAGEREKFLYDEFVRQNHATRLASWILGEPDVRLGLDRRLSRLVGALVEPFDRQVRSDLALLCGNHHRMDLDDTDRYPVSRPYGPTRDEAVNLQYLAALLLSADLLAITGSRRPSVPQRLLHASDAGTDLRWTAGTPVRAVRSQVAVDPDGNHDAQLPRSVIEVHAVVSDAAQFFALTGYLRYTEAEVTRCHRILARSAPKFGSGHDYPWQRVDQQFVQATGFVARSFRFGFDPAPMLELLIGHTLYNDANVVVRELVQNSIDAVRLQHDDAGGKVVVRWDPGERVLSVEDNGSGMTGEVLEEYLLRAGSSRYQSPAFRRAHHSFSPIGRFGIGFLAVFMVSDHVEIITAHEDDDSARSLTLQSVHSSYLMRLLPKDSAENPELCRQHGTSVRLHLRPSADLADVTETLRRWVVVPGCSVAVTTGDGEEVAIGHENVREALSAALFGALADRMQHVEVRGAMMGGVEIAYAVNRRRVPGQSHLAALTSPPFLGQFDRDLVERQLGICVEGVRVTTASPGYQATDIVCLVNSVGHDSPRTNLARTELERTPALDRLLRSVYQTLAGDVRQELRRLVAEERLSPGAAASEANCLVAPLLDGAPLNPAMAAAAAAEIPAYVVESATSRRLMSLTELEPHTELASVESDVTARAELLLAAAPNHSSLRDVMRSWKHWSAALPDVPMLCRPDPASFYGELFVDSWEITSIEVTLNAQLLDLRWRRAAKEKPRWLRSVAGHPPPDAHPALRQLWAYDNDGRRTTVLIPTVDVPHNIDRGRWDGIRLPGLVVVLPNPVFSEAGPAPDLMRHALAFVVRLLDRQQTDELAVEGRDNRLSKAGVRDLMVLMRRAGLMDYIDAPTLVSTVSELRLNLMEFPRPS